MTKKHGWLSLSQSFVMLNCVYKYHTYLQSIESCLTMVEGTPEKISEYMHGFDSNLEL